MDEQIKQIDELLKVLSRQASYGDSRAANLVPVYKELRQSYVMQMTLNQRINDIQAKLDNSLDKPFVEGIIAYHNDIVKGFKERSEAAEEWVKTAENTMDYQAGLITELGVRAEAAERLNVTLLKNLEDAAHALTDVRRFVQAKWMSVADLPSEEAVLFDGPEPKHEANAIIAALNRVAEYYEKE